MNPAIQLGPDVNTWPPALRERYLERLRARRSTRCQSPFQKLYRSNYVGFVHDCIEWKDGEGPAVYQDEILTELPRKKRVAVRGPHGLGKTGLAAWVVICFALTRDGEDWKCPTTASAWRQLTKYLWPEIHKWSRKLRWDKIGRQPFDIRSELLQINLKLATGEAFAVASDNHALIEGAHADSLLYLFDEAKAIPVETFDASEGAFSGGGSTEAFALAISTPGEPVGRFYDIHSRRSGYEDWWTRHVTLDEAIDSGRISRDWAEQRKKQWGEDSAIYHNRVLGEFCASDEDGVIPLAWIEAANERWRTWEDAGGNTFQFTALGVDVGGGKARDNTSFAYRRENVLSEIKKNNNEDTMQTAGRVAGVLKKHRGRAVVDVIGIGAGVVARLKEQKLNVIPFNASERSTAKDRSEELGFVNKRSAAWWNLREMLDPANNEDIALPPDDLLTGDLTAPHWRVMSGGKIQIESKDDIKKRIGRSTDDGDAVVMAFYREPEVKDRYTEEDSQSYATQSY